MKEARFIVLNRDRWKEMERLQQTDAEELAARFVELSDDLAYARTFYPGSETERYLNRLVAVYQSNIASAPVHRFSWLSFWKREFPLLLARERRTLGFVFVFFMLCVLIGIFSAAREESFVRLILGDAYVNMTVDNITAGKPMRVYDSSDEWTMFFEITINNIKVSFSAFALGILFSAGSLYILFVNGVMLGAFQCFFYKYNLLLHSSLSVWAHGTFEITSILIAGAAGVIMGNSFLFPGTYPRLYSFRQGALSGVKIIMGLIPFFILAGLIESFVTRHADAHPVLGGIVIGCSLAGVIGYFILYPYRLSHRFANTVKTGNEWKRLI